LSLVYSTALFGKGKAEKILKHLVEILEQVMKNPMIKLHDISLSHRLSRIERNVEVAHEDFVF
jgi:hypothetical protein